MQPISPMLAHVADVPFDSEDHLFEIKWDGIRALAFIEGGRVRLQSREGTEITAQFPELLSSLRKLPVGTVLDGELVVIVNGSPERSKVLRRMSVRDSLRIRFLPDRCPATFVAFDLLHTAGKSWMPKPLFERRFHLLELIGHLNDDRVLASPAVEGSGIELYRLVQERQLEGVMAKRMDGRYLPGRRSRLWLKILCAPERTGMRTQIGAVSPRLTAVHFSPASSSTIRPA